MNNTLTWQFDVTVMEWLITLVILILLAVVGTVVARRSHYKVFRKLNDQSDILISASENWHIKSAKAVLVSLDTAPDGLSSEELTIRLGKYGLNRLPEVGINGPLIRFFYQFHNVLIYVLIVASAITAMLGHWVDASVIFGVVLINAVIGFVQEGKAENAFSECNGYAWGSTSEHPI